MSKPNSQSYPSSNSGILLLLKVIMFAFINTLVDIVISVVTRDGDFHVPMVGRHHAHDVDILIVEHAAIIARRLCFAFADMRIVLGAVGTTRIDIADGRKAAEPHR